MLKVTLPLDVLGGRNNVASLKVLRAREEARSEAGPSLQAVESFKSRMDDWTSHVDGLDDTVADSAPNEKGHVVLKDLPLKGRPCTMSEITSAELKKTPDGFVSSCKLSVYEASDTDIVQTDLSYKRTDNREVYTEKSACGEAKLILDHTKGILTYEDCRSGDCSENAAAWPAPSGTEYPHQLQRIGCYTTEVGMPGPTPFVKY